MVSMHESLAAMRYFYNAPETTFLWLSLNVVMSPKSEKWVEE